MTTEPTNNNQEPTENPNEQPTDGDTERKIPESAFKLQIGERDKKIDTLQKQLDSIQESQKAAEEERLAKEGKHIELANKRIAEAEAKLAEANRTARQATLKAELAGITNEWALKGALSDCPEDADPVEWAAKFKADNPTLWEAAPVPSTQAAQTGRSATGSNDEGWAKVRKDYESGVPDRVRAATIELETYKREHRAMPPGW